MNTQKHEEARKNVQEARFGPKVREIPDDWDIGRIGDNTYLKGRIGWHGLTEDDHLEDGEYYLITGTDFEGGRVQWDRCKYVNEEWYEKDENIQLEEEDILVTKDGSIGKTAFIEELPGDATLNNGIFVLRPLDEEYIPKFLYYVLNSFYFDDFIETITAGSTISHLYQKDFVNFRFPLPPLPEQRLITNILSKVDEKIQLTDQIISKTEELKQGLLQDLITNGIGHESYKEALLGPKYTDIPTSWDVERMADVADVVSGSTPKKSNPEYWGGDIVWVTPTDVTSTDGMYISDSEEKITAEGRDSCSVTLLEPGAVLMTSRATIGEAVINEVPVTTNQGFKSLVPGDRLHNEYLYYYIRTIADYLTEIGGGSTFPEINKGDTQNIPVPVPPLNEQKKIANNLNEVDEKRLQEQETKQKLQELKRGLMQDLLTGKTRVDPES